MTPLQYWFGWVLVAVVVTLAKLPFQIVKLRKLERIARALENLENRENRK